MLSKSIIEKAKKTASDPAFNRPIAELKKDYSKRGVIILVTKIKPVCK